MEVLLTGGLARELKTYVAEWMAERYGLVRNDVVIDPPSVEWTPDLVIECWPAGDVPIAPLPDKTVRIGVPPCAGDVRYRIAFDAALPQQLGEAIKMVRLALVAAGVDDPQLTRNGLFDSQVCVPAGWTDEQVVAFANAINPCGTTNGWQLRKQADGEKDQPGYQERVPCDGRPGYVHIMLDA